MANVQTLPSPVITEEPAKHAHLAVYSHSPLVYWWPVWVLGYSLALLTYFEGERTAFAEATVLIHPSKNLGVIFTMVCVLVLLMTHATVRGVASLTVVATVLAGTFLFAYLGWWDDIFRTLEGLALYMNLGFYVFFSTAVFILWVLAFFFFDRFSYWTFRPGQAVHHVLLGGGAETYDSVGMSVSKLRDDLFRHWILGLGSGDLHISTSGAKRHEFVVPNVLFIGRKVARIQQLMAMKPDESDNGLAGGSPG